MLICLSKISGITGRRACFDSLWYSPHNLFIAKPTCRSNTCVIPAVGYKSLIFTSVNYWLSACYPKTPGWFDDLLRHYNSKFPSLPDIIFNQEFKIRNTTDFATLVIAGSQASSTGQNVQKGQFSLCILGPSYDDLVREKLVKELEHSSTSEQNRSVIVCSENENYIFNTK